MTTANEQMKHPKSHGPVPGAGVLSPAQPVSRSDHYVSVLLISDFLLARAGLRHALEAAAITVVREVATCEEAVSAAKDERPDIILLDFDSRAETLACVESLVSAAQSSRLVALCDRARASDVAVLVELGAMGAVLKSEPPEVLIKAIRKVHAGEVWLNRGSTAQVLTRIARRRRRTDIEARKIAALTKREHEIIALIGEGLQNAAIGQRLFISVSTVRNHLTSILDKLGVADRFELAVYAFRHGLVHYTDADMQS